MLNYYFQYDTNGNIYPVLSDTAPSTTMSVLGPYPKYTAPTNVVMAYLNPNYYMVQGGDIVARANIASLQLADAQRDHSAYINQCYNNTLVAGFTSSATGTAHTFAYADKDQMKFLKLATDVQQGNITWPAPIPDATGAIVEHTQAQYAQLAKDISSFEWTNQNELHTLLGQIQTATTVDALASITW